MNEPLNHENSDMMTSCLKHGHASGKNWQLPIETKMELTTNLFMWAVMAYLIMLLSSRVAPLYFCTGIVRTRMRMKTFCAVIVNFFIHYAAVTQLFERNNSHLKMIMNGYKKDTSSIRIMNNDANDELNRHFFNSRLLFSLPNWILSFNNQFWYWLLLLGII